jgi:predicted nucleic acid-binding protein
MKIIVDTNVIFSAILSPSGKIGQILIYGRKQLVPTTDWSQMAD